MRALVGLAASEVLGAWSSESPESPSGALTPQGARGLLAQVSTAGSVEQTGTRHVGCSAQPAPPQSSQQMVPSAQRTTGYDFTQLKLPLSEKEA